MSIILCCGLLIGSIFAYCVLFMKKAAKKIVAGKDGGVGVGTTYSKLATSEVELGGVTTDEIEDEGTWEDDWSDKENKKEDQEGIFLGQPQIQTHALGTLSKTAVTTSPARDKPKSRGSSRDSSNNSDIDLFASIGIEAKPKF